MEVRAEAEETRGYVVRPGPAGQEVEDLVRQLLEHAHEQPAPLEEAAPAHEVMLEVRMDGHAYQLVRTERPDPPARVHLSPREQEIVRLVAKGLPTKAIADVLDVSLWTVATHLRRVFTKLGVSSRAEMVARALQEGLLSGG
jgi:DNA-binding NarL/FixJ family response regulator